jgi:hypothetical protein
VTRLREHLHHRAQNRDKALPRRAWSALKQQSQLISRGLDLRSRALELSRSNLERELNAVKSVSPHEIIDPEALQQRLDESAKKLTAASHKRIISFCEKTLVNARALVEVASVRALSTHLPGSLQDAIIGFANEESKTLRGELDELTRSVLRTHGAEAERRLFEATLSLGFRQPDFAFAPPPIALEAGLVFVGIAGTAIMYFGNVVTGMVMTFAGPMSTVLLREQNLRQARTRARDSLPEALASSRATLEKTVSKVIEDHADALREHVMLANTQLQEQVTAILARACEDLAETHTGPDSEGPSAEDHGRQSRERLQTMGETLRALDIRLDALEPKAH